MIHKERQGGCLGSTVQTIPHITDEIKRFIYRVGETTDADIVITEIGGTIGDIESQPFIEAIRQVGLEVGRDNALYVHVTLVPYLRASGEHKSKPTQHSVKELQSMGISPDIIVLRVDEPITDKSIFAKIAHFCNVKTDCVIENQTLPILYEAPLMLERAHLSGIALRELGLSAPEADLAEWQALVERIRHQSRTVKIGLVGKYVQLHDAYLSVAEALRHAGYQQDTRVEIDWIDSEELSEDNIAARLAGVQGLLVPGGFGARGVEGMILCARYAREHRVPYFGICLGMQVAVIEFARNVARLQGANSREFDENAPCKVIDFMPDQSDEIDKGGTLRLGKYPCALKEGSVIARLYGSTEISERHRHRYEFANAYRAPLEKAGLTLSGLSPDGRLVETIELSENTFYIGVQFHPEFKSRPNRPHPLFAGFIRAAADR